MEIPFSKPLIFKDYVHFREGRLVVSNIKQRDTEDMKMMFTCN